MQLNEASSVLELCCGNGVWTLPLSKRVKQITAVDFSKPLLGVLAAELARQNITNVTVKMEDVVAMALDGHPPYTHVFLYFALQHFSERETVLLFEKAHALLKHTGGMFYIGGIPDRLKLWDFANTREYEKIYFDEVKHETPSIGTWFIQEDLVRLADYAGFSSCERIALPGWQMNSHFRFDLKLQV